MSASQALCLTRLGRPFLLPRESARRVVPLTGEEILTSVGVALVMLEGLPAVLIEPERLTSAVAEVEVSKAEVSEADIPERKVSAPLDGSVAQSLGDPARLAVVVDHPGELLYAIAADQVRPAGDGEAALPIDLRKGLMDGD